jgi:hypothetical protein
MPNRMVNDKTLTLRADIYDSIGRIVTSGCFGTLGTVTVNRVSDNAVIPITVTIFDNHLPVPDDSIRFYHGVGSVSFTLDAGASVPAGDYRVTVTVGTISASKIVTVLSNPTWRVMPATLAGADLTWGPNENIRISLHDTEVPAGSTLTINPGTLVMVDTTGGLENGTLITVNGQINAVGSQDNPIHFFSNLGPAAMIHTVSGSLSNENAWRGIYHFGSGSSTYKWMFLTGAGNGPITGHPRPPIFSFANTHSMLAEDDVFVDSTGMMFQTPGTGTYTLRRMLVSRVGIGCEFLSAGHTLVIEDSWWTGIGRGPTTPQRYDGDGIHIDGAGSSQNLRRIVIADIGDDEHDRRVGHGSQHADLQHGDRHSRDRAGLQQHDLRQRTHRHAPARSREHHLAAERRGLLGEHQLHRRRRRGAHGVRDGEHHRRSVVHRHGAVRLPADRRLARSHRRSDRRPHRLARIPVGHRVHGRCAVQRQQRVLGRHLQPRRVQLPSDRRLRRVHDQRRLQRRQRLHGRRLRLARHLPGQSADQL